jgi:hypothetical protein
MEPPAMSRAVDVASAESARNFRRVGHEELLNMLVLLIW